MVWTLFAVAVVLAVLLERIGSRRRTLQKRHVRLKALEQIRLLRLLLEQVQRHRGLCFGVMSGEHSLENQRWQVEAQVARTLEAVAVHQGSLFWYTAWHPVLPVWQQIAEQRAQNASAEAVLLLHHRMAEQLISTIEALAVRHDLVCLGALAPQPQGMWLELLKNTELLGRARAVGTGIAARRQNSALQHQELQRLREQINTQCYQPLARLCTEPLLRLSVDKPVRAAEDSLDSLLQAVDQLLESVDRPGLASNRYFSIATQAISATLAIVDLLLERLQAPGALAYK
ncbi:nitrate- and nitrite sensing domain-containing protein [Halopseudomonas sp.]|jgi:hypothetical protein|uniref:nitrate- and nitrite sensing domain-containing protein n=1 Tax=Halopseudomonas sp. TaxID=2901191 RepID=UPI0039E2CD13